MNQPFDGDGEPPTHIQVSLEEQDGSTQLTFKVDVTGTEPAIPGFATFLERTWGRVLNNLEDVLETEA